MKSYILSSVLLALFLISLTEALPNSNEQPGSPRYSEDCSDCRCGTRRVDRIYGGSLEDRRNHPWLVQILHNGSHWCGANLISRRHVLTAAHCLKNTTVSDLTLKLADSSVHKVSSFYMHRFFNKGHSFNNDIAIMILSKPVTLNRAITTVCLPKQGDGSWYGTSGNVTGWGKRFDEDQSYQQLRTVEVPILTHEDCRDKSTLPLSSFSRNQLCAGFIERGERDSCHGDSGGPLIYYDRARAVLAGIVSWGISCGLKGYPGVYTKVSEYRAWINSFVLSSGECFCPPGYIV